MTVMTDVVREAVLNFLDGKIDLDELEDTAIFAVQDRRDERAEKVLHIVSTAGQFSNDEFRQHLDRLVDVFEPVPAEHSGTSSVVVEVTWELART